MALILVPQTPTYRVSPHCLSTAGHQTIPEGLFAGVPPNADSILVKQDGFPDLLHVESHIPCVCSEQH